MNLKTFTTARTALTIAATFALPTSQAEAKGGKGLLIGGLVGAAIVGTAVAASAQPGYYYGGHGYRNCRWVAQYNHFGHFVGNAKVCRYY
jgi:hypothetical protein